jgi:hypothetical protein
VKARPNSQPKLSSPWAIQGLLKKDKKKSGQEMPQQENPIADRDWDDALAGAKIRLHSIGINASSQVISSPGSDRR